MVDAEHDGRCKVYLDEVSGWQVAESSVDPSIYYMCRRISGQVSK